MNPNELFPYFFDVSDVLSSTLDQATGAITLQLGDIESETAESHKAEQWQGAAGILSRPALPTQGKASCQVFHIKRGNYDVGFAYRDLRATAIYGNTAPGDTAMYATAGSAITLCRAADGSSRLLTTDNNQEGGNTLYAGVSAYYTGLDGLRHLGGEWRRYAPWGGEWHDQNGYHFRHWTGVKIDAGGYALPSPLSQNVATYQLSAGMVTIDAGVVALGHNDGTAEALTKILSLKVQMTAFAADVATFTTALNTYLAAQAAYAAAIKSVADPSGTATTTLAAAIGVMETASTALSTGTSSIMAAIDSVAGCKSVAGS